MMEASWLRQPSILLVALFALSVAFPTPSAHSNIQVRASSETCTHPGNSDFYGFGIRIGIYLQILTTMVSMLYMPETVSDCEDANAVLLLAIFIALGKSVGNKELQIVDVIILLRMLWLIIICGFSLPDFAKEVREAIGSKGDYVKRWTTKGAVIFRWALFGFIAGYNVWFWFRGLKSLQVQGECPTFAFFFAKLDVSGGLRRFYNLTSIVLVVVYGPLAAVLLGLGAFALTIGSLLVLFILLPAFLVILAMEAVYLLLVAGVGVIYLFTLLFRLKSYPRWKGSINALLNSIYLGKSKGHWLEKTRTKRRSIFVRWHKGRNAVGKPDSLALILMADPSDTSGASVPNTKPEKTQGSPWRKTYLVVLLLYFIFSVIGIELTISWNSVEQPYDLGSTGQLIPFVIGILSTAKVLGQAINEIEKKLYKRILEHYPEVATPKHSQEMAMGKYQMVKQNKHDKQDRESNNNDAVDLKRKSIVSEVTIPHDMRAAFGDETGLQSIKEPIVEGTKAEDTSEYASLLPHQ